MLTRIVAFATLTACASLPVYQASTSSSGRPVILLVHGRGLLDRDTAGLRRLWQQAIESGGRILTRAPLLEDGDVRLVWYADVLDPTSNAGCDFAVSDRRPDSPDVADLRSFASAVGGVVSLISNLIDDRSQSVGLRSIVGDLSFIADSRKRCAVDARLTSALEAAQREGRPAIVVAHSLGSVVTYDALSTATNAPPVERLVTVGGIVGAPGLRQLLLGGSGDDTLRVPASVKSWVNIRRPGDPFAAPLSSSIIASREGRVVRDVLTDSPDPVDVGEAHDVISYLHDGATARAILSAWCGAFEKRPAGCTEVRDER
jgi:hypothetical protein